MELIGALFTVALAVFYLRFLVKVYGYGQIIFNFFKKLLLDING